MATDKLYRVIKQREECANDNIWTYYVDSENAIYYKRKETPNYRTGLVKVGEIVDSKKIDEWVVMGLNPIYFVEEVKERYGKFENLKELTRDAYDTINEINLDRDNIIKKLRKKIEMLEAANKSYKEDAELTFAGIIMQNKMNKIDNYNLKGYFIDENDLSESQEKAIEKLINEE